MPFDGEWTHAFVLLCEIGIDAVTRISMVQVAPRLDSPKIVLIVVFDLSQYTHHQGLGRKLAVSTTQSLVETVETERRGRRLCSGFVVLFLGRSLGFRLRVARRWLSSTDFLWWREELLLKAFTADRGERRSRGVVLRLIGPRVVNACILSAGTSRRFAVGIAA